MGEERTEEEGAAEDETRGQDSLRFISAVKFFLHAIDNRYTQSQPAIGGRNSRGSCFITFLCPDASCLFALFLHDFAVPYARDVYNRCSLLYFDLFSSAAPSPVNMCVCVLSVLPDVRCREKGLYLTLFTATQLLLPIEFRAHPVAVCRRRSNWSLGAASSRVHDPVAGARKSTRSRWLPRYTRGVDGTRLRQMRRERDAPQFIVSRVLRKCVMRKITYRWAPLAQSSSFAIALPIVILSPKIIGAKRFVRVPRIERTGEKYLGVVIARGTKFR